MSSQFRQGSAGTRMDGGVTPKSSSYSHLQTSSAWQNQPAAATPLPLGNITGTSVSGGGPSSSRLYASNNNINMNSTFGGTNYNLASPMTSPTPVGGAFTGVGAGRTPATPSRTIRGHTPMSSTLEALPSETTSLTGTSRGGVGMGGSISSPVFRQDNRKKDENHEIYTDSDASDCSTSSGGSTSKGLGTGGGGKGGAASGRAGAGSSGSRVSAGQKGDLSARRGPSEAGRATPSGGRGNIASVTTNPLRGPSRLAVGSAASSRSNPFPRERSSIERPQHYGASLGAEDEDEVPTYSYSSTPSPVSARGVAGGSSSSGAAAALGNTNTTVVRSVPSTSASVPPASYGLPQLAGSFSSTSGSGGNHLPPVATTNTSTVSPRTRMSTSGGGNFGMKVTSSPKQSPSLPPSNGPKKSLASVPIPGLTQQQQEQQQQQQQAKARAEDYATSAISDEDDYEYDDDFYTDMEDEDEDEEDIDEVERTTTASQQVTRSPSTVAPSEVSTVTGIIPPMTDISDRSQAAHNNNSITFDKTTTVAAQRSGASGSGPTVINDRYAVGGDNAIPPSAVNESLSTAASGSRGEGTVPPPSSADDPYFQHLSIGSSSPTGNATLHTESFSRDFATVATTMMGDININQTQAGSQPPSVSNRARVVFEGEKVGTDVSASSSNKLLSSVGGGTGQPRAKAPPIPPIEVNRLKKVARGAFGDVFYAQVISPFPLALIPSFGGGPAAVAAAAAPEVVAATLAAANHPNPSSIDFKNNIAYSKCIFATDTNGSNGDANKGVSRGEKNVLSCNGPFIAVKDIVVTPDAARSREAAKQVVALQREIYVMQKLSHRNIVRYLGSQRNPDGLSIFMEYADGGTVGQEIRTRGKITESEAKRFTMQLLNGLEYLHQRRIVHRDLKGDNLFLMSDKTLKVGDFGTSKEMQSIKTATDSIAGTPNFMAPEAIDGSGHGIEADIWSVGCCVIQMVTGKAPFRNYDNQMAIMFAIMKGKITQELPVDCSEELKDFLKVCTRTASKERWNCAQLKEHAWLMGAAKGKTSDNPSDAKLKMMIKPKDPNAAGKNAANSST